MIRSQIQKLLNIPDAVIDRPENQSFGDYSTNAVLKLAKKEGKNPMELAQELAQKLSASKSDMFSKIEVALPGFINFTLSPQFLRQQVQEILKAKENYGALNIGQNKKIQVEFISANPTGPLTLGNGRGGFFGDVLANVLSRAGFSVKREYFVNDAGFQVEVLGHSVLKDEQAQYKGEYIDKLNKKFVCWLCSKDPKKVGQKAAKYILAKMLQPTIKDRMKIKFDEWVSEGALRSSGATDKVLAMLKAKNLTYEQDGATWFKSTQFGDDKDRVLITSAKDGRDGAATYLLPDAAYHYKKFVKDKFDKVINIWGADHHGYILRLQAIKKALNMPGELEVVIMQLVRLMVKGEEVKMSKRLGTYITLDELLEEIPLDVARFFFLMRAPNTHMDFDLDLAKEQSQKNPVYYVQYAYARICSILRKAHSTTQSLNDSITDSSGHSITQSLNHSSEFALIKQLIRFPEVIEDTAKDYGVHRLPQYSMDLVRSFHKFYEECRVLPAPPSGPEGPEGSSNGSEEIDEATSQARLALCEATRIVLANTLSLMGISAPEKM